MGAGLRAPSIVGRLGLRRMKVQPSSNTDELRKRTDFNQMIIKNDAFGLEEKYWTRLHFYWIVGDKRLRAESLKKLEICSRETRERKMYGIDRRP